MFPLPCSTQIIVKRSNSTYFPTSIISVISLFIGGVRRGFRGGGDGRWWGSTQKEVWESVEIREIEGDGKRAKSDERGGGLSPRQSWVKNISGVIFFLLSSYFGVKRGLEGAGGTAANTQVYCSNHMKHAHILDCYNAAIMSFMRKRMTFSE